MIGAVVGVATLYIYTYIYIYIYIAPTLESNKILSTQNPKTFILNCVKDRYRHGRGWRRMRRGPGDPPGSKVVPISPWKHTEYPNTYGAGGFKAVPSQGFSGSLQPGI